MRTGDNSSVGALANRWNEQQAMQDLAAQQQITAATTAIIYSEAKKFTDEAYRTQFERAADIYETYTDENGKVHARKLSEEEKHSLQPATDGKIHVANNGIFNDLDAAA